MAYARRIFPDTYLSPSHTFNLLLLSEGFRVEQDFDEACHEFVHRLLLTTPFNISRYQPSWINVYTHFVPSTQAGPALGGTPGNTPFGSTYDQATGTLVVDPTRVADVVLGLTQPGLSVVGEESEPDRSASDFWPAKREPRGPLASAVVVLLPASVNGTSVSGEMDHPSDGGIQPRSTQHVPFAATTIDGEWHQVVLRVLGRRLGLGDEFELSDQPGQAYGAPTATEGNLINWLYRNLVYLPTPPTAPLSPNFKWWNELDPKQGTAGLNIVPHKVPVSNPDYTPYFPMMSTAPFELVEGGAGFRQQIYRSAHDCLMRRQIGSAFRSQLSLKNNEVGFCTICQRTLTRVIAGTLRPLGKRTLSNQTLIFDEANWLTRTIVVGMAPPPGPPSFPGFVYWACDVKVGKAFGGLLIENLKLKGHSGGEDVALKIAFRDIVVSFNDGTTEPFNLAAAFDAGHVTLEYGRLGTITGIENNYAWGVKLTLEDDFGKTCPVRVEMSLTLKAHTAIEPTGFVKAMKFFPQIGLTWSTGGSKRVKKFRAAVHLIVNNYHMAMHKRNIANFLTDTNAYSRDTRQKGPHSFATPVDYYLLPDWAATFDYFKANIVSQTEIVGVYGPDAPLAKRGPRKADYQWPPGGPAKITLDKQARQGQYDNVHVHGYMGIDTKDPLAGPLIHAPACGEACFHLHWRWGERIVPTAQHFIEETAKFKGWGHTPATRIANTVIGAPLIPPNQHLTVAITDWTADRSEPFAPLTSAAPAIDPLRKGIWYTVDVSDPGSGERQVILEQGIGWAYDYSVVAPVDHQFYEDVRWFPGSLHSQVPSGDWAPAGLPKMEDL